MAVLRGAQVLRVTRLARSGSAACGSPLAVVRALQVAGDRAVFGGGSGRIVGDHAGAEADGGDGDDRAARGAASVVEDGQVGGQDRVVQGTTAAPGVDLAEGAAVALAGVRTDGGGGQAPGGSAREAGTGERWGARNGDRGLIHNALVSAADGRLQRLLRADDAARQKGKDCAATPRSQGAPLRSAPASRDCGLDDGSIVAAEGCYRPGLFPQSRVNQGGFAR